MKGEMGDVGGFVGLPTFWTKAKARMGVRSLTTWRLSRVMTFSVMLYPLHVSVPSAAPVTRRLFARELGGKDMRAKKKKTKWSEVWKGGRHKREGGVPGDQERPCPGSGVFAQTLLAGVD